MYIAIIRVDIHDIVSYIVVISYISPFKSANERKCEIYLKSGFLVDFCVVLQ